MSNKSQRNLCKHLVAFIKGISWKLVLCRVREDIVSGLQLRDYFTAVSTFDRPNIFYGVRTFSRTSAFREELGREVLKDISGGGSTLIYCTTVKDVQEVCIDGSFVLPSNSDWIRCPLPAVPQSCAFSASCWKSYDSHVSVMKRSTCWDAVLFTRETSETSLNSPTESVFLKSL